MFPTMKQTMYNENIFAERNLHLIVGGVLDNQDLSVILCSYLLQLPVIISHHNPCSRLAPVLKTIFINVSYYILVASLTLMAIHVAETEKSKMVLICPYKKLYENGWVG